MSALRHALSILFLLAVLQLSDSYFIGPGNRTNEDVRRLYTHPTGSNGTCAWFGYAPICYARCPDGFDEVRRSSKNYLTNGANHHKSPSFGSTCYWGKKALCCYADRTDCSWQGSWTNSLEQHFYCMFFEANDRPNNLELPKGTCGYFKCQSSSITNHFYERAEIGGEKCNQLTMFGLSGRASCGLIEWRNGTEVADKWYKFG